MEIGLKHRGTDEITENTQIVSGKREDIFKLASPKKVFVYEQDTQNSVEEEKKNENLEVLYVHQSSEKM